MLHNPHYRDRLRDKVFGDTEFTSLFNSWEGGSLITWRWGSLADAVRALKKRKGALITYWDLSKYLSGHVVAEDDARARRDQRDGFVHTFDKAMRDEFFWAYLDSWLSFQPEL